MLLFNSISFDCFSQNQNNDSFATLSGIIVDVQTGERLPGATIKYLHANTGVLSNQYGFFSLTNQKDSAKTFEVRYIGYSTLAFEFSFKADSIITIGLQPETAMLDEISIEAESASENYSYEAGKVTLSAEKIRSISSFAGEPDVLKSLQLLPGVQSGNEGTTNISVRGGSYDQNLILLDEAPVYNASHALSFFSIFNIDAIHSVDFYKSDIPTKYGGRLSSVVDIRMKEGNRNVRQSKGSIGIVSSRLTTEGPIFNNGKWSYMFSGRYSYAGHVVNGIYFLGQQFLNDQTANRSTTNNRIHFYDLNGKINFSVNDKNQFFISSYSGSDQFYFNHITSGYDLGWGNRTLTLRWNHIFNKKLFSNSTLINSRYNYEYRLLNNTQYFLWSAMLNEQQLKQDYDWYLNDSNHIKFGFGVQNYDIDPGQVKPRDSRAASSPYRLDNKNALSTNVYFGNTATIGTEIQVSYGVRYTNFGLSGRRTEYVYAQNSGEEYPIDSITTSSFIPQHKLEPRASIRYALGKNRFSVSYDRTVQFLHLLANSSVGLPTDIWWPSSNNIKPQIADIYVASYEKGILNYLQMHFSLFYKSLENVVDFKDNAKLFVNKHVESQMLQGKGASYGAEMHVAKIQGKFTGSLSYTYSKTFNRINGVNNGESYPNRYDKRHNLSLTFAYPISDRIDVSSNLVVTSGGALTMPVGSFVFDGVSFNTYGTRNNYRFATYHRLDLSFRYRNEEGNQSRRFKHYWSFDIYNVYGQRNPFTLYSIQEDNGFLQTETHALFLYRIVPTLSFNFAF